MIESINSIVMPVYISDKLLDDLVKGKEEAYVVIFNKFFNRLCQFAQTYVIDHSVAQNIVQDVFMKLWENKKHIKKDTSFFSYLITITKNCCLDYLKHKQVEANYKNHSANYSKELVLNYHALNRLEVDFIDYKEMMEIVEKTLKSLPPQCQRVFRLSRFEELSNSEVAEKLGIGKKAVEAQITKAIKIFRNELKDYITILIFLNIPIL